MQILGYRIELILLVLFEINDIFFFYRAEENGNLLMFFRNLSSYAEWCEHRRCTFLHFKVLFVKPFYMNTLILKWLIKREQCR